MKNARARDCILSFLQYSATAVASRPESNMRQMVRGICPNHSEEELDKAVEAFMAYVRLVASVVERIENEERLKNETRWQGGDDGDCPEKFESR